MEKFVLKIAKNILNSTYMRVIKYENRIKNVYAYFTISLPCTILR